MMMNHGLPLPDPGPLPKTALITGGAGALGFEIAKSLADHQIAIIDIGDTVEARAAELPDALGLSCDLGEPDALHNAYLTAFDRYGPFGVVVHAAGIAPVAPFLDTDRAAFTNSLNVNLTSAFDIFRLAARDLVMHGKSGRLIAIASISGARAGYARTAYGTAKAGLIHLTGQIALELGPYGITANAVAPGPV
ncbi:MAG: SDR family NAD(P)-dependent oxidoreductase, partial [Pseudomonadota bacterium]